MFMMFIKNKRKKLTHKNYVAKHRLLKIKRFDRNKNDKRRCLKKILFIINK